MEKGTQKMKIQAGASSMSGGSTLTSLEEKLNFLTA